MSSAHDPALTLLHLSKRKYRSTKASQIRKSLQKAISKSNWTFFQHSLSNTSHCRTADPKSCQQERSCSPSTAGSPAKPAQDTHSFAWLSLKNLQCSSGTYPVLHPSLLPRVPPSIPWCSLGALPLDTWASTNKKDPDPSPLWLF